MKATVGDPAVEWLLGSSDPSIHFLTLTEVLGRSRDDSEVQAASSAIVDGPRFRKLVSRQQSDGGFSVHPYRKWMGGFWRLVALAEMAAPPSHPALGPLIEHVLAWLGGEGRGAPAIEMDGRVRAHATQDGFALAALCKLGRAEDPAAQEIASSLVEWQWPDGGWNCDRIPAASHSSFHETHGPVWGLAEFLRHNDDAEAASAVKEGAEFLLRHQLFRSERSGDVADPALLRLRFPTYWHYDVLQGLWVLSGLDMLDDPRAGEALDLIESKRRPDGLWRAEGYWWKPQGSAGSNVEVVDWGRRGPNEWVTLRALRVLKSAGRLS